MCIVKSCNSAIRLAGQDLRSYDMLTLDFFLSAAKGLVPCNHLNPNVYCHGDEKLIGVCRHGDRGLLMYVVMVIEDF